MNLNSPGLDLADLASIGVIICYILGTIGIFAGISKGNPRAQRLANSLTLAGFALHTLLIFSTVLLYGFDELSRGYFMQLLSWILLLIYFVLWQWLHSSFLALTASPLALILYVAALKLGAVQAKVPPSLVGLFYALHIGPLFLSFGLLALAFGSALLFMHMERKIKTKSHLSGFDREMPALATFDRINKIAVLFGLPLYTLGLASGFIWAPMAWGKMISWDPKEVISLFIWFLYALLFHQRIALGWQGRKAAIMLICLFSLSVFSLVGVNFFMPTHHSFISAQP